jgi:hypothetical protein
MENYKLHILIKGKGRENYYGIEILHLKKTISRIFITFSRIRGNINTADIADLNQNASCNMIFLLLAISPQNILTFSNSL